MNQFLSNLKHQGQPIRIMLGGGTVSATVVEVKADLVELTLQANALNITQYITHPNNVVVVG